jgi:hypothetical protein
MRTLKIAALSVATVAAVISASAPADARPRPRHKICHVERHHGHSKRVCHWVR